MTGSMRGALASIEKFGSRTVVVIGEDVAGGAATEGQRDAYGGVLGVTKGLFAEFGEARVIYTPITESAIMGAAAGAAVTGLRPVAELMFSDFFGVCFDQIFNQAAKFRYMFGGKAKTPMVIRTAIGAGLRAGAQHSQTLHPLFTMVPGLKVVMPATDREFAATQTHWLRFRDGLVVEHWANRDDFGMAQQLGWAPPSPAFLFRQLRATRRGSA